MKKEIIGGILIVFIVGGLIFFQQKNSQQISQEAASTSKPNPSQTSKKETANKKITIDEVSKHSSDKDCWMVIEGKVYDLTNYIDSHPGGRVMVNFCGKDGTQAFNARGPKKEPHSPAAREILKDYYLAELEE